MFVIHPEYEPFHIQEKRTELFVFFYVFQVKGGGLWFEENISLLSYF